MPRTPIKETERRAAGFEARYGEGATELDALEALHSGELRNILVAEINRYLDPDFRRDWQQVAEDVENEFDAASDDARETYADELAPFNERYQKIRAELDALITEAQPIFDRMATELNEAGEEILDAVFPEPPDADEDEDPLYDSERDYVEQIDRYKAHQGKPITRVPRGDS